MNWICGYTSHHYNFVLVLDDTTAEKSGRQGELYQQDWIDQWVQNVGAMRRHILQLLLQFSAVEIKFTMSLCWIVF